MKHHVNIMLLAIMLVCPVIALAQDETSSPQTLLHEPGDGDTLQLNFRDAPVATVLQHLSEVSGLVIVQSEPVPGTVTVLSRQPLTTDEAIAVLNSVLVQKGFAAIRTGRMLKIVKLEMARRMNVPVHVGSQPDAIADTDEVITQVVPIRNADAPQLVDDLQPLFSESASVAANASSNAIVITDTSTNVRRLVKVIAALDTAIDIISQVRVFPLQYANATDAARLINDVFDKDSSGSEDQPGFRAFFRGRGGPGGQQDSQPDATRRADVPVRASADDRTNTVVVSAPPEVLDVVAEVLAELDANPAAVQGVFVYKVVHGQAENLATVLNNLFDSDNNSTSTTTNGTTSARNTGRNGAANATPGGAGGQPGGGGRSRFIEAIAAQLGTSGAEATTELVGQVTVVADTETNSLLVMTAPTKFDRVREIIGQLDVAVPQVLIKVLVAEVTHNNGSDIGLEYSVVSDDTTVNVLQQFGIASAVTSGLPGFSINVVNANLDLTLRALQEIGKLEVLSRPYILASDNQPAVITVGQEVPLITNTQFTELGGVRNTIRYEDVGIILNVTPHIGPDGLVTMDISPEISALSGETVQISEDYDAPVIAKRSAETRVALMSGQTIIIGGLMEDQKTQTRRQIPILGSIPVLGMLFSRNIEDTRKTELLIFLTPQVAEHPQRLDRMTQQEEQSVEILRDAVGEGTYDQHRRGMQAEDETGSTGGQ